MKQWQAYSPKNDAWLDCDIVSKCIEREGYNISIYDLKSPHPTGLWYCEKHHLRIKPDDTLDPTFEKWYETFKDENTKELCS